jgi:hypothetical protein
MAFFIHNKEEHERFMRDWTWERDAIEAIHEHARFRFTADGRFYSMALDGESIGDLMRANGCPDFRKHPHVARELRAIAGAIVVYDEHGYGVLDEILPYRDNQELIDAWRELHEISGVVMNDADAERLAEYDEDEDE